jgi:hypothetical protein
MKANSRPTLSRLPLLLLPLLLTGCSLLPTTRKLPIPKAPLLTKSVTPEGLVEGLNRRWEGISSLTAKVEFRATKSKSREGVATDYPTVEGHILMRKPEQLRVVGQLIGVRIFDMASDGKDFSLSIPHENLFITGSNSSKTKSKNTWENLRPGFFFDAMLVRALDPNDLYQVVTASDTVEDAARKHLFDVPQYILSISRRKPGTQQLIPVRVVTFRRDNLLPYKQDLYDADGNIETEVNYSAYQDFEGSQYPSTISINRPQEEITIVLTVEDVHENLPIDDHTFTLDVPQGAKVEHVE